MGFCGEGVSVAAPCATNRRSGRWFGAVAAGCCRPDQLKPQRAMALLWILVLYESAM